MPSYYNVFLLYIPYYNVFLLYIPYYNVLLLYIPYYNVFLLYIPYYNVFLLYIPYYNVQNVSAIGRTAHETVYYCYYYQDFLYKIIYMLCNSMTWTPTLAKNVAQRITI